MIERSWRRGLAALVVGWALVGSGVDSGFAEDDGCEVTCGGARRGCEMAGRAAYTGCKQICREGDSRRACRHACSATFETAREACDAAREECRQVCGAPVDPAALSGEEPLPTDPAAPGEEPAPADPGVCVAGCRDEIRGCVEDVVALGQECVGACLDGQRAAVLECLAMERPGRCLAEVGGEAGHCLHECSEVWNDASEGCREVLHVCRESCGSPVDLSDGDGSGDDDSDDDADDDSGDDDGDDDADDDSGDDDSDDDADDDDDHHGGDYGSARRAFLGEVRSLLD